MSTYTVKVGPGQQLIGAASDTTMVVHNTDQTNAIRIDKKQPTPGHGTLVNPLASVVWSAKSGPIWACVEAGVTSPVNIEISEEIDSADDPVATAAALAVQGVPNVLTSTFVGTYNLDTIIPVAQYASLLLTLGASSSGAYFNYQFFTDAAATIAVGDQRRIVNASGVSAGGLVPVIAPYLKLSGISTLGHVSVYGTNRNAPGPNAYTVGYSNDIEIGTANQAMTAGTPVPLLTKVSQGRCFVSMEASPLPSGCAGTFEMVDAWSNFMTIGHTAEMQSPSGTSYGYIVREILVPASITQFRFKPTTTGSYVVGIRVTASP